MKQKQIIILYFWITSPAPDLHNAAEMRTIGEIGVYEPGFIAGDRKTICMNARFDIEDKSARNAAIAYAIQNAKMLFNADGIESKNIMWGLQVVLNGHQMTEFEISQIIV